MRQLKVGLLGVLLLGCVLLLVWHTPQLIPQRQGINASFAMDKAEYCAGEPILLHFSIANHSHAVFPFALGRDHGTGEQDRFSITVRDQAGRNLERESAHDITEGDTGSGTHFLQPVETSNSYLVLTNWTHLLPPGDYTATCSLSWAANYKLRVADKDYRRAIQHPVALAQQFHFKVLPYNRQHLAAALQELLLNHHPIPLNLAPNESWGWQDKPVSAALGDVADKLGIAWLDPDPKVQDAKLVFRLVARLPATWNDASYLEYAFNSNHYWLPVGHKGAFRLTFRVSNHSNLTLPHQLAATNLLLNGKPFPRWPSALKQMLNTAKLPATIAPGQSLTLSHQFYKPPNGAKAQSFVWKARNGHADLVVVSTPRTLHELHTLQQEMGGDCS